MNSDVVRFILQVAAIFAGGGTVQLALFLLKRRSELRQLDTASDATALNSANAYIVTLQSGDQTLRTEIDALKAALKAEQNANNTEHEASVQAMGNATREVTRVLAELARVKSDLIVANSQLEELGQRLARATRDR